MNFDFVALLALLHAVFDSLSIDAGDSAESGLGWKRSLTVGRIRVETIANDLAREERDGEG